MSRASTRGFQDKRAVKILSDWIQHSAAGDFARAVWAPTTAIRAHYGARAPAAFCHEMRALHSGADLALLNTGDSIVVVTDVAGFLEIAEEDR